MAADVRLGLEEVAVVHVVVALDVSVRVDDVAGVRLDLHSVWSGVSTAQCMSQQSSRERESERGGRTMRSVSQSVPEPLRRTSSGLSGMMLHSEKTKGCTYFMYR